MTTERPTTFGALLKYHRLAAGLTQEALAEQAALSARAISDLERGVNRVPQHETVVRLAAALGLDASERAKFQMPARHLDGRSGTASSIATHSAPLLLPLTPLIGREREEAGLRKLVIENGARLITLTGPGGVGKTRLALQVASGLQSHFGAGASVVSLAPVSDPTLVLPTVAQVLGVPESPGHALRDVLIRSLSDKHLLLVLDNFEQVAPAAVDVAALAAACPHLTLLISSRAPLHIREEHVFPVPPLGLPALASLPPLDDLAQEGGVALFVHRAQALLPAFRLTPANAPVVAEICIRLDGLPLAIELAATRLPALSPEALLVRLERRLPLLTGGPRDLPARQQTLRATLSWSYDLLDDAAQRLFRCLGVFVGGCTLEALEAVCRLDAEGPDADLMDPLSTLVDSNLLRREEGAVEDSTPGETRYTMLETVREYAVEQLAASGETAAVAGRHAAYYLALAEQAQPYLTRREQLVWLARLEAERGNLRAAIRSYLERAAVEEGLRLVMALFEIVLVRAGWAEQHAWLTAFLALPAAVPSRVQATALGHVGLLHIVRGATAAGQRYLEESRVLGQQLGDQKVVAWATLWLGSFAFDGGEYGRAQALLEESLALYRALDDPWGTAEALIQLGRPLITLGSHRRARTLLDEGLAIARRTGDRRQLAFVLEILGEVALAEGNPHAAGAAWEESLVTYHEVGAVGGVATIETLLGHLALRQGEVPAAHAHYAAALHYHGQSLLPLWVVQILGGLALLAAQQSQADRCLCLAAASASLAADAGIQSLYPEPDALEQALSVAHSLLGERAAAVWAAGQAMTWDQAVAYALDMDLTG